MRHVLFILVLAAAAIAAAFLLLPGDQERFAIAMRDGHPEQAFAIARQQSPEESTPSDLFAFYKLALQLGDTQTAEAYILACLKRDPDALEARQELVRFYRETQDDLNYRRSLADLFRRNPSPAAFQELVGLYRMAGDVKGEIETFEEGTRANVVHDFDIARAGMIYAATGRPDAAAVTLSRIPFTRFADFRQAELTYLTLLVRKNQSA